MASDSPQSSDAPTVPQRDRSRSRDSRGRGFPVDEPIYMLSSGEVARSKKLAIEMHMILIEQYLEDIRKMTRMIKALSDMQEEIYQKATNIMEDCKRIVQPLLTIIDFLKRCWNKRVLTNACQNAQNIAVPRRPAAVVSDMHWMCH